MRLPPLRSFALRGAGYEASIDVARRALASGSVVVPASRPSRAKCSTKW